MTAQLRIDPWQPQYGPDVEFQIAYDEQEPTSLQVDTAIEQADWSHPPADDAPSTCPPLVFVDGVRRVEFRLVGEEGDGRTAPGLVGSFGVGAVIADGDAAWLANETGRVVVLGGGMTADAVRLDEHQDGLIFRPLSVLGSEPLDPLHGLQKAMRDSEARLATRVADRGWVLADGPLVYPFADDHRIVGIVKRSVARYLPQPEASLLPRLDAGQRTPLFALGHRALDRFAWYQRLLAPRPHWHAHAGLVRCEVRMAVGLDEARLIADTLGRELPRYAGRVGIDPRAPQNLVPVGALETRLRHLLGDAVLVRRRLEAYFSGVTDTQLGVATR